MGFGWIMQLVVSFCLLDKLVALPVPQVYSHQEKWLQFLMVNESFDNKKEIGEVCKLVDDHLDEPYDIKWSVAVREHGMVVLPCIYCGSYSNQMKYWNKTRFHWDSPFNLTKRPNKVIKRIGYHKRLRIPYVKEVVNKEPNLEYTRVLRKDNALYIENFKRSDAGMYTCTHDYWPDRLEGLFIYNVEVITPDPSIRRGQYIDLYKLRLEIARTSMENFKGKFFEGTMLRIYFIPVSKCNGCGGSEGFINYWALIVVERKEEYLLTNFSKTWENYPTGAFLRGNTIKELHGYYRLKEQISKLLDKEFYLKVRCMVNKICPDKMAAPQFFSHKVSAESLLKNNTLVKVTKVIRTIEYSWEKQFERNPRKAFLTFLGYYFSSKENSHVVILLFIVFLIVFTYTRVQRV